MIFASFSMAAAFGALAALYYLLPPRPRPALLLVAGYALCAAAGPVALLALWTQTLITYTLGRAIGASADPRRRRSLIVVAVILTLGVLGALKYARFGAALLEGALRAAGLSASLPVFDVLLPLGISFYSLQALGYVLDVAAGRQPAERHLGRYALFVGFFPALAAGPIARAPAMLPQHRAAHPLDPAGIVAGLKQIAWGLFKKAVIADRLAVYVDAVYAHPDAYGAATLMLASYAFAFQLYCDFSGYSDMAIGAARVLGYRLPENFRRPYAADSLTAFWHRWHLSLSTWFRDYLYLPLGGSRVGTARWVVNIAVVFVISGLWHGAGGTFILWGLLHAGAYLSARALGRGLIALGAVRPVSGGGLWRLLRIAATFQVVALAWVAFRAPSLEIAGRIYARLFACSPGPLYLGPSMVGAGVAAAAIAVLLAVEWGQARGGCAGPGEAGRCPAWAQWIGYGALLLALSVFGMSPRAFVYLQF